VSNRVIAVTPTGVGMVTNISCGGIAFKCSKAHDFPTEMPIDIYDSKGNCVVENMVANQVWEKQINQIRFNSPFSVEVGMCFSQLTASQKNQISNYLNELVESGQRAPHKHCIKQGKA
jgi:hypothetical protein